MDLHPSDFARFFRAVHNCDPFPWQQALVNRLADCDQWPDVLDLPTGAGKTATLDAAVFHLALRANTPGKAALRIVLVVDRRLVVDEAYVRAKKISLVLSNCLERHAYESPVVEEIALRLQKLAGKFGQPLIAQRLRGGTPLEYDWARTPTQPLILCSTVDQVGSRLLFRGYGVSDRMKPIHAGLFGTNCLILMDEAHLSEPFRQTLSAIQTIGNAGIQVAQLSATPGTIPVRPLMLSESDRIDPVLRRRLEVSKPVALKSPVRGGTKVVAGMFAEEAQAMANRLRERGIHSPAVGIVVNRVALARNIFMALEGDDTTDSVLMIGRSRSVERGAIVSALSPFKTNERSRSEARSLFVVATQCMEVGVDLDLDGLVSQVASLDALRQRFGRLNRAGRPIDAQGTLIACAEEIAVNSRELRKVDDPVYGDRINSTWKALEGIAESGMVDFGVEVLPKRLAEAGINLNDLASKRPNAPAVMPAYLDLWSQTSPRPTVDPEVGLFLHGAKRVAAGVSIVWRSDINESDILGKSGVNLKEIVRLFPPRSAEVVEVPLWAARAWLNSSEKGNSDFSDAPECENEHFESIRNQKTVRRAFRWSGYDDIATGVVSVNELCTGDLIVVPSEYGGCDRFGWIPDSDEFVVDVADEAARPYWRQRCAVRVARDIVQSGAQWNRILDELAAEGADSRDLVEKLLEALPSESKTETVKVPQAPRDIREQLIALNRAKGRIDVHYPYAQNYEGGAVLVAEGGIEELSDTIAAIPTTEDDSASHTSRRPVFLDDHGWRVACFAKEFTDILDLDEVADDVILAARLHDAGKADPRFQIMLAGGDHWNRPEGPPLAKGGCLWSPKAWKLAKLPPNWRHEALSVRMARAHPLLSKARDPYLVLWLIGSHHGFGRPFFHFTDPAPEKPLPCFDVADWCIPEFEFGPQSMAFDFTGLDWPSLFENLKRRYGIWGLAHLETVLRLADHRASEEERSL